MPHDRWETTSLWQELLSRDSTEASGVRASLQSWMPDIERVLDSGATSPKDFTLHDAEHSFRVAEWMVRLLPADMLQGLSDFEVALLLLSAYLHDIGMTPEVDKVRRHRDFLLSGKDGLLTETEEKRFQRWLDDAGYAVVPPLTADRPLDELICMADEIITYYTRYRHNDWSEEWARNYLIDEKLGSYMGWLDDLVRLCRSHHEGYDVLAGKPFNPRRVGSPAQVVQLRYLAVLLRVSDILDIDPERTLGVIFRHRAIARNSQLYWKKDAQLTIDFTENRISATARPPKAFLHRAVTETIDAIEHELVLSRRLDDETHFEKAPGPSPNLPHRWNIQSTVYRDIEPGDQAYEYIDGAFRPNTHQLLDLLSGMKLYGNPLSAIRELLQNAFDAVRELVAYQRLRQPNPEAPELAEQLGKLLRVRIHLNSEDGRTWLVCSDEGVGMTKKIIADHLLVSGSPVRSEVVELERRCDAAGFSLGRTGHFGIGALSYFMLADKVVITTRRATEPGDFEANGWRFEIEGFDGFGELKKDYSLTRGTDVRLRIRSNLAIDAEQFWSRLIRYIQSTVIHTPCTFELVGNSPSDLNQLDVGWTLSTAQLCRRALSQLVQESKESASGPLLLPHEQKALRLALAQSIHLRKQAVNSLHWYTVAGELPNRIGIYRLHIPRFRLPGGNCFVFLDIQERGPKTFVTGDRNGATAYQYVGQTRWAWKGMKIESVRPDRLEVNRIYSEWTAYGIVAEIDFRSPSAGQLSANRAQFLVNEAGYAAIQWISDLARSTATQIARDDAQSKYSLINFALLDLPASETHPHWITEPDIDNNNILENDVFWEWSDEIFPHVPPLQEFRRVRETRFRWNDRGVLIASSILTHMSRQQASILQLMQVMAPDRVVAFRFRNRVVPVPLRSAAENVTATPLMFGSQCVYPPEWSHVCGISGLMYATEWLTWNAQHPLVSLAAMAPPLQRKQLDEKTFASYAIEAADNAPMAATLLLLLLLPVNGKLAQYLIETRAPVFREIWRAACGSFGPTASAKQSIYFYHAGHHYRRDYFVVKMSLDEYLTFEIGAPQPEETPMQRLFPLPKGKEWLLQEVRT